MKKSISNTALNEPLMAMEGTVIEVDVEAARHLMDLSEVVIEPGWPYANRFGTIKRNTSLGLDDNDNGVAKKVGVFVVHEVWTTFTLLL